MTNANATLIAEDTATQTVCPMQTDGANLSSASSEAVAGQVAMPYRDHGYLGLSPRLLSMEDTPALTPSFHLMVQADTRRQAAHQLLKRALYH